MVGKECQFATHGAIDRGSHKGDEEVQQHSKNPRSGSSLECG
jgi:hypothetical protein